MNRRIFLKFMALNTLTFPLYLHAVKKFPRKTKKLILIELQGGNDGLNTVIPYKNPLYYQFRPNLSIPPDEVLKLDDEFGLHPSLIEIKSIFEQNEVAIINGLGYPNPNRSHFRSIEIWNTASNSDEYLDRGWLNYLLDSHDSPIKGVVLGGEYGPLFGSSKGIIKINDIEKFLRRSKHIKPQDTLMKYNDSLRHLLETELEIKKSADLLNQSINHTQKLAYNYKRSNFGKQLDIVTQLVNSSIDNQLYKLRLGSFDTHFNQSQKHAKLLKELSGGLSTLRDNLIKSGEWGNTIVMTYSEFGRKLKENSSKGTDHGTVAPHFIIGGSVMGGIYGKYPSLKRLDKHGDLMYTTDFRMLYSTIVEKWFHNKSQNLLPFLPMPGLHFNVKRDYKQELQEIKSDNYTCGNAYSIINYIL